VPGCVDALAPITSAAADGGAVWWGAAVAIGVATVAAMEPLAGWLHRRVWHGPLWWIHATHHTDEGRAHGPGARGHRPRRVLGFEGNDVFAGGYGLVAMIAMAHGLERVAAGAPALECSAAAVAGALVRAGALGLGAGVSLYGLLYMVVHDGLSHGRFPVGPVAAIPWLRRVAAAHRAHHRAGASHPWGLFGGPRELRVAKAARARVRESAPASAVAPAVPLPPAPRRAAGRT
jgi:beta-carotene 3-hydroxylase